jgi:hypothetical protein
MSSAHVEVLVEERSMAEALRCLLPKMLSKATWDIHEYRGKSDLLKKLPARLRGYRQWIPCGSYIVVLVDRDDEDCVELKARLESIAHEAGLATKSCPDSRGRFVVVNRVAIEELEAWYFGDWVAVREVYPKVNANVPSQQKYRSPDVIKGGTWEAFERLLQSAGHLKTSLRKIETARAVAARMDPSRNTSPSFQALRAALAQIEGA